MMQEPAGKTNRIVGIEASNTVLTGVCLDSMGALTALEQSPVTATGDPVQQIIEFIGSLRDKFGGFDKIGVAVPGLLDSGSGRILYSALIPEHAQVDLSSEIRTAVGVSPVIENDANAAAYGEFRLGAGRDSRDLFYATLGEGVGGAFIIDGKIWRGAAGCAGEFGYVTINSDGMRLEEVAATRNIVRRTRNRFHQDHTSSLNKLDEQQINIGHIIGAAERGDDFAMMMLQRTGTYVGTALASVINLLNIERIVVGGEIMRAGDVVLNSIIRRARELSFSPSFNSTKILAGELSGNAAAVGAALLANK